jgi:hypothetical protein
MALAKPTFSLVGPNVSFLLPMQKIFIILSSNKALCVERVLTEFQRFVYLRRKEVHVNGGRGRRLRKMRHAATASRWRWTNATGAPNHVKVNSS